MNKFELDIEEQNLKIENYKLMDLIFFAWTKKITAVLAGIIIFSIIFLLFSLNNTNSSTLEIEISAKDNFDLDLFKIIEDECTMITLNRACGYVDKILFTNVFVENINFKQRNYKIISFILKKYGEFNSTDIHDLADSLSDSINIVDVINLKTGFQIGHMLNLSYKDAEVLKLMQSYLIPYLEKDVMQHIFSKYKYASYKLKQTKSIEVVSIKRELDIINDELSRTFGAMIAITNDDKSTLLSTSEYNPFQLLYSKQLQLEEWNIINVDLWNQKLNELQINYNNDPIFNIERSKIVKDSVPNKRNFLFSIFITFCIIQLYMLMSYENMIRNIKKRSLSNV